GAYAFNNIAPGDYVVEVTAEGFTTFTSPALHLNRGQSLLNDVQLSIDSVSENVVVTASGSAQRVDETSKAITSLNQRGIEARRELTLSEALRGVPGLRIQQQGHLGGLTSIRMRGLRSFDTAVLLDGLRVRDASDINGSVAPLVPDLAFTNLDRVEILRGS